ncbi:MAG: hypothetical protein C4575_14180 [Desulforudis sp.]|nr:MAG: hypothetical protein C4575_14180 [Desulforudis sp.]
MLNETYQDILKILRQEGTGILVEDDYADFKNFFAKWKEPQLEETCVTIEFILRAPAPEHCPTPTVEFYCLFYTSKKRYKQKILSGNKFDHPKQFLDSKIFTPVGLTITKYFDVKRDYKTYRMRPLFINNMPGVIIVIGGFATQTNTYGGAHALSTR